MKIQVGIKEFRHKLAEYLEKDEIIEIMRRGKVIGEYRKCTPRSVHPSVHQEAPSVHNESSSVHQEDRSVHQGSDKLSDKEVKLAKAREALANMGKVVKPEKIEKPNKLLSQLGYVAR